MAAADQFVEEVVFRGDTAEVQSHVRQLYEEIEKARRKQEEFADALSNTGYLKSVRELDELTRKNRLFAASQLESARTTERMRAVRSGDYLRQLREEVRVKEELRRIELMERSERLRGRREDLQGRYGPRVGGALAAAERVAGSRAAGLGLAGVGGAGAFVWSQARAGMEGTAELERFNTELMLARRSLAGAFKPALDTATTAVTKTRRAFDGLSGTQQDVLMGGTLAALLAGGAFATSLANVVAKRALGAGLGTLAGEAVGSMGGRVIGTAVGNVAGTAAGTAAGNLASGTAGGMAARAGAALPGAGGLVAAGAIPLAGAALATGYGIYDALYGGYYSKYRESGFSPGKSLFSAFGSAAYETSTAPFQSLGMPSLKSALGIDDKSRLTESGGGFRDLGAGFDEMTAKRDTLAASDYSIASGQGGSDALKEVASQVATMVTAVGELVKVLTFNGGAREHRGTSTVR